MKVYKYILLSAFCFIVAFKRIGIVAVALALAIGLALKFVARFKRDTAARLTVALAILIVAVLVGYVAIIKMGVFELIEKAGIDTSGRVVMYDAVDKFYEFSPEFLGNGIGFLSYQLTTNMSVGVNSVHNDFLQYFIDLGFWGYILWLLSMTVVRTGYFGAKGRVDNAILTLVLSVYLIIVSSTDNTINFPLLTTVLAVLMIGHGFDERVRETEQKIFGYVSPVNRIQKKESLL